ncbi:MAG: complex I subunit 1 family protein [Thermoguttaceae bacterium]|jgi:NADH-quinone oxidoreductase subunit H
MLAIAAEALVKIVLVLAGLMTAAAYLVLVERRVAGWIQDRLGPNRAGIPLTRWRLWGLGQPIADGGKLLLKGGFTPAHVDKLLYFLAPAVTFATALAVFAVVPFGSVLPGGWLPESWGVREPIRLVIAPGINVGILYVFAMGSIAVYGVVLGGWASNNKYSFFGGLRSSAQLISYELPLGLGILGIVLGCGSLNLDTIILQQAESGVWNVLLQPLGLLVFGVAACAEATRVPFDLPEAEQELVGGYHTEYSGAKLMMFLVGEYLHMITASFLIVILFFGGWHFWGLTGAGEIVTWPVAVLRVAVLLAKVFAVIFFFMVARWSWLRFRYDQLMSLAWLVMLPLGMVNVVYMAGWEAFGGRLAARLGIPEGWAMAACGWAVCVLALLATAALVPASNDNTPRRVPIEPSFSKEGDESPPTASAGLVSR